MHEVNSYHSTFGRAVEVVQCGMRQEVEELLREAWWQSLDTASDLNSQEETLSDPTLLTHATRKSC